MNRYLSLSTRHSRLSIRISSSTIDSHVEHCSMCCFCPSAMVGHSNSISLFVLICQNDSRCPLDFPFIVKRFLSMMEPWSINGTFPPKRQTSCHVRMCECLLCAEARCSGTGLTVKPAEIDTINKYSFFCLWCTTYRTGYAWLWACEKESHNQCRRVQSRCGMNQLLLQSWTSLGDWIWWETRHRSRHVHATWNRIAGNYSVVINCVMALDTPFSQNRTHVLREHWHLPGLIAPSSMTSTSGRSKYQSYA